MTSLNRGLTGEELRHFEEHGYVIVKGVLKDDDFAAFEEDYNRLIDAKADELLELGEIKSTHADAPFDRRLALIAMQCSSETISRHIAPFGLSLDTMYARQKGFFDFQFNSRLLAAVESIVGPEITLSPIQHCRPFLPAVNGNAIAAGSAVVAPWHQDQGVTREEADASDILTCWIPLTDVTAATGCLKVIPGVHKTVGLLEHIKTDAGTTIKNIPEGPHINCEMSRGDLLFMHKFTPHCSQPNRTDKVRWSLDLRFQVTGTPTGRHFWPELIVKSMKERVVRDYDAWSKRWEKDLISSVGERWHRVAGDVGGSIGGESTHSMRRISDAVNATKSERLKDLIGSAVAL